MTNQLPAPKVSALLTAVQSGDFTFLDVISFIDDHYHYTPTTFRNGEVNNTSGTNEGSCKVFGFAKANRLNQTDTLSLFCEHYKKVQDTPSGHDHANIRAFRYWGWQAFDMPQSPLRLRVF